MSNLINVVLLDDHDIVREGFRKLLEAHTDIRVVGDCATIKEAQNLINNLKPDILVADINLNGVSGLELIKELNTQDNAPRIIVLSIYEDEAYLNQAYSHGAHGYLSKRCAPSDLIEAIHAVIRNGIYISNCLAGLIEKNRIVKSKSSLNKLSEREFEVFQLLAKGHDAIEISKLIHLSSKTIHVHRANILKKLGVKNVVGLVYIALRNGAVEL